MVLVCLFQFVSFLVLFGLNITRRTPKVLIFYTLSVGRLMENIDYKDFYGAACDGDCRRFIGWLERGADVNQTNIHGWTALHFASYNSHPEIVRLLLEFGANINQRSNWGYTALHYASELGCLEIARLLLDWGVNVDQLDRDGCTALHYASYRGHLETVRLLLERGVDATLKNNSGKTAVSVVKSNDIKELFAIYHICRSNVCIRDPKSFDQLPIVLRQQCVVLATMWSTLNLSNQSGTIGLLPLEILHVLLLALLRTHWNS